MSRKLYTITFSDEEGPISSLEVEWDVAQYSGLVRLISATLDEACEEDSDE